MVRDEELVEQCKAGDRVAFRELFQAHRGDVARLVHRMLGPSPDLEDVVQEIFFQVHRSIKDFRGTAKFNTWLYRVAVNVVLMHRRAARSRPLLEPILAHGAPRDVHSLPDEQVERVGRIRAFYRLLDRLTEKKRAVFILHELEGMSPSEISKLVGAPVLTVRTRLFYARRELAAMLGDEPSLAGLAETLSAKPAAARGLARAAPSAQKEPV